MSNDNLTYLKAHRDDIESVVSELTVKANQLTAERDKLLVVIAAVDNELDRLRAAKSEQPEFDFVDEVE